MLYLSVFYSLFSWAKAFASHSVHKDVTGIFKFRPNECQRTKYISYISRYTKQIEESENRFKFFLIWHKGCCQWYKKHKQDKDSTWKRDGDKQHYCFNQNTVNDLEQTLWEIKYKKFDYCTEVLTEAIEKVDKRNKLLKLSDTSEGGWDKVKQYTANPLASD